VDIGPFYRQILEILTTPPGNLVYHLVLSFSIAGAFLSAFSHGRAGGTPTSRRVILGLFLLLLAQMALMLNAGLAQYFDIAAALLPVLDRAVVAFSLALILWLWAFPEPFRLADTATILLALLVLTLTSLTRVWWANQLTIDRFNGSAMDQLWVAFSLALSLFGSLLLLIRRPPGFGAGLGMFGLFFLGQLLHLLAPLPPGDYPGAVRLAQLAAYPFLLALPSRFPIAPQPGPPPTKPAAEPSRSTRPDSPSLQAFLTLSTSTNWPEVCQAAAVSAAYTLQAENSFLILPPDAYGRMQVKCGYNLQSGERIPGLTLDSQSFPLLSAALKIGRALRLNSNSTAPDLAALVPAFQFSNPVSMLFVPVLGPGKRTLLGILLLSPMHAPLWTTRDQEELSSFSRSLSAVLQRFLHTKEIEDQLHQARRERENEEAKIDEIERRNEALLTQLQDLQRQAVQERARSESLVALINIQENSQETISRLQAENERLARLARPWPLEVQPTQDEVESLRGELRVVLEEVARLRSEFFYPDEKKPKTVVEPSMTTSITEEKSVTIFTISQELRQPLASIQGYTDLLLSESVGILGALQRKFLERVKASAERLGGLVDALIRVTLEASHVEAAPNKVELQSVVAQALADSRQIMSKKEIQFQLDIPERLPHINAVRSALHQALYHLLQNACTSTPPGGEVSVRARLESGGFESDYVLIQVTDQGGGIPDEDQERVFSQIYRPGAAQIQVLGKGGAELVAVKTLIEAQGGRVWLDTQPGEGTTFSLILPVYASAGQRN
jgi:signal transduction histidine kinase